MASRSFPANTQVQKFLEESYNKERDMRLAWHAKVGPKDGGGVSKQFEVFKRKIESEAKPTINVAKDGAEPRYNRRIIPDVIEFDIANPEMDMDTEMRPASPDTKTKLYDGFTKEGKGRYQYLSSRYKESPEDKFTFPLLSSWEYGWRLSDVIKKENVKKPVNGRTRIVADTFYTRTGIPSSSH